MEVDGHAGLVARRHHLHRRVLQESREADVREGRVAFDLPREQVSRDSVHRLYIGEAA